MGLQVLFVVLLVLIILVLLYLLMIMPRMLHKPDSSKYREWLYAHRGLHDNAGDAPENSLLAFRKAVDAGYGIELDIQLSKDCVPVVFHDYTLKRICGKEGKVCDYTYAELREFRLCDSEQYIPTFAEVLQLVDGKVPLIVEFKIEKTDLSLCPIADRMLRDYHGPYVMESFNPLGVRWYRKHHPEIIRGQLASAFKVEDGLRGPLYFALCHLLFNRLTRPDFVAFNHKHPKKLSRRLCHGMYHNLAAAWTIKSEEEMARARENFDIMIFDSFVPQEGGHIPPIWEK